MKQQIPKPYKHQIEAFNFIKEKDQFALFCDQGTGKTRIVIDKMTYLYKLNEIDKVIIITLNFLKYQWIIEELKIHCPIEYDSFIYESSTKTKKYIKDFENFCNSKKLKILSVNVEAFQSNTIDNFVLTFLKNNGRNVFIVIDESTCIKNPKAKRTQKIIKGFRNRKYKCILSGTPTPNTPADLYSQFEFLIPNFFRCSYHQFKLNHILMVKEHPKDRKPYFTIMPEKKYKVIKNVLKKQKLTPDLVTELAINFNTLERNIILINGMNIYNPFKNMVTLNQHISKITFKVMKKDCLDLPNKIYEKLIVELNPEQKRLYKDLKKHFFSFYENKQLTVSNALSFLTKLRLITGGIFTYQDTINITNFEDLFNYKISTKSMRIKNNPKIKAIKEDLENVNKDTSIIIWGSFVEELLYIYDELKEFYTCALYFGRTTKEERIQIKKDFINKKIKILIANPTVAGMGLNLQVSTLHYFYSNSYRSDIRLQAEDRSHRSGQTNKVLYKDVIAKNSVDEVIYNCLINKINIVEYFKDKNNLKNIIY